MASFIPLLIHKYLFTLNQSKLQIPLFETLERDHCMTETCPYGVDRAVVPQKLVMSLGETSLATGALLFSAGLEKSTLRPLKELLISRFLITIRL
jgi:hypothetical protein